MSEDNYTLEEEGVDEFVVYVSDEDTMMHNQVAIFQVEELAKEYIELKTRQSPDVEKAITGLELHIENLEMYMNYHDMMKIDKDTFMKLCKDVTKIKNKLEGKK